MQNDYIKARKNAEREYSRAVAAQRNPYLKSLDQLIDDVQMSRNEFVGFLEIPLSMVTGTVTAARAAGFAANYMPIMDKDSEFAYKWSTLYDHQMTDGITDPIKVYEYLWEFYVLEGNKRVSVMKYLNNPSIYAQVTRILPKKDGSYKSEVYYEFLDFYRAAPIYEIVFSHRGSYQKLAELLHQNLNESWPEELVRSLEASFIRFSNVFYEKGGNEINCTVADAFLKYLSIYNMDSLLDKSHSVLENRLQSIWNELLVDANRDNSIIARETADQSQLSPLRQLLHFGPRYSEKNPLKIAFIHEEPLENSAWVNDHETGRIFLNHNLEGIVQTRSYLDCHDDLLIRDAVDDAVRDGAEVIFTTSASQFNATLRCAADYPDVRFYNCIVNLSSNLVKSYYGRLFEAKYLMGILAGQLADNHKVGYLADYPIYGTVTNLNAFALGVAAIDPQARIYVRWLGNPEEGNWKQFMDENGIRIVSGKDIADLNEDNFEYGVFRINEDGSIYNYGFPIWNWGRYYELIVKPIIEGNFADDDIRNDQSLFLWWGLSQGVIDVSLSKELPYYTRKTVDFYRSSLINGSFSPFEGELHSQSGVIQTMGEKRMNNEKIISMDWLNDNIVGNFPHYSQLDEGGKQLFRICGIRKEEIR